MGQSPDRTAAARVEYDEKSENGLIFGEEYLPEELLVQILCYVDYKSLLNCRLVCKRWNILLDRYIWRKKAEMSLNRHIHWNSCVPWAVYYLICKKRPFERNLIKNHSGEEGVNKHWKILSEGGDRWTVESPPLGVPPLPDNPVFEGKQSCFVTTYSYCTKMQTIDLKDEGFNSFMLDKLQPPIVVGEWYSCRWDCAASYQLSVKLLTENNTVLDTFQFSDNITGDRQNQWHYASHEFNNYGPGLKKICFYHSGKDRQFWAGHYGSKMAGASVYVKVPNMSRDAFEI